MQYRLLLGIALTLLLPAGLAAQTESELSLADAVTKIVEESAQTSVSRLSVSSALNTYRSQFAQALPQVTFTADPAYGINKTKLPVLNQFGVETSNEDQTNQQVGAGVSLSQALPTGGSLSLSVHNATTISDTTVGDTTKTVLSQTPKLSVSLTQPLFVNKKLIDMQLFPATLKSTEIPYLRSIQQDASTRNSIAVQGISTYLTVVSLRRQLDQARLSLDVQKESLDQTRLAQANGRATENDVMVAEMSVDRQSEGMLELEYSLQQSETALARLLGRTRSLERTKLSDRMPEIALGGGPSELLDRVTASNPDIQQSRLDVENARVQSIIGGQTYAPNLSLSLSVAPQYGYNRPDSDLFGNSFSQLFDTNNGAYTDVTFSVGMQVPLYNGGRAKKDKASLTAGVQIAEKNLSLKIQTLKDSLDGLFLKQSYLSKKVALTEANVTLEARRLQDKERLRKLSSATDLDVKSAEAALAARRNDLWSARVDLFLNTLDIISLTGGDIAKLIGKDGNK